jgi:magnesium transporter
MKTLDRKKVNPSHAIFTGENKNFPIEMQLFKYNSEDITEDNLFSLEKLNKINDDNFIYWINIHGIHEVELIEKICEKVGIHQLAIQDILDVNQRPKLQDYGEYWFFSLKSVLLGEDDGLFAEQISFIMGKNYLISFQERKADYFEHIRQRLKNKIGIVRDRGSDYLIFLLLEAILDNYFKTLNSVDDIIKSVSLIENDINLSPQLLHKVESLKYEIYQIKKTIIPIRDFIITIERENFGKIEKRHIKYFLEIKDLCMTLIDQCEQIELRLESSVNLFFSLQGHKMNQIMKTLTIVATIFIPLTFVAGIYGMNFPNIPEIGWRWGYAFVWAFMIFITLLMFIYFRRKKWF